MHFNDINHLIVQGVVSGVGVMTKDATDQSLDVEFVLMVDNSNHGFGNILMPA